jgi:hypothetical protein
MRAFEQPWRPDSSSPRAPRRQARRAPSALQAARRLEGTATLRITATQDLTRFDLDLRGFQLGTVTVGGVPAAAVGRDGQELVITPAHRIRAG